MSHAQRTRRRRRGSGGPRNKALLALMVLGICVVLAGLAGVGYIVSVAASAPPLSSLKPRITGDNTRVFAADGKPLGFIQAENLHLPLSSDEIPQLVKDATIAIEDERYYKHKGVDYEGIVRAAIKNLTERETVEGGSTITMQLVRSLYISNERTYTRKIREAKLAEELEETRSKEWILEKYLDSIPYGTVGGQSAIGIKAAAKIYFSKGLKKLTLREAALLAGLPQAPSNYSPITAKAAAKRRRDQVLRKMAELGMVTQDEARKAMSQNLGIKRSEFFTRRREEYFFDYVKDQLFREYGAATVRQGGMKVYTTIDLEKQEQARDTIADHLGGIGPSSAIVTLNQQNGYIEAMASSGDYGVSNFNLAAQGHRRPGSTFKIMALMTALRRGVDPDATSYVSKSPTYIDDPAYGQFEIKTYSGSGLGSVSLRQGTLQSDNSVYIQLAMDLGPDEVKRTARDMGITSTLKGYPAETLGGLENGVSPLEMATAYASIANGGFRIRPTAIKKIVFPDGRVEKGKELPQRFRVKRVRIFEDGVAAKGREILEQNMTQGTGGRAIVPGCATAGKTGTTDNNTDAWFVGFTPRMTTAVWVGYPKDDIEMNTLYYGGPVDGGTFPAEIWGDYMGRITGGDCGQFKPPKTPFVGSPFNGRYASSGGSLTGGPEDDTSYDPTVPAPIAPAPEEEPEPESGGESAPDGGDEGFDPTQYESAPQGPPETEPPPDAGLDGGAVAPG